VMPAIYKLRVFTDRDGGYGDQASVVVDEGKKITDAKRQAMTRQLGTGETVFINDVSGAKISVMHYDGEIDFAGVPALAAAWVLTKLRGNLTEVMHGRGGDITTWQEADVTWVRADLSTMPPWHHKQLENSEAVERLTLEETKTMDHTMVWAWIDETKGLIRARTFAGDWGMPEAQGNGSGSMLLAAILQRPIQIKHGQGSLIFAKPVPTNNAAIGGYIIETQEN
jgi:predicted PhzF superfamily epimerase YddE/YHI9